MINSEIIRSKRKALGLSQQDVCDKLNLMGVKLSQPGYRKIEKGEVDSSTMLPYICQVLGLSISEVDKKLVNQLQRNNDELINELNRLPKAERIAIVQSVLDELASED